MMLPAARWGLVASAPLAPAKSTRPANSPLVEAGTVDVVAAPVVVVAARVVVGAWVVEVAAGAAVAGVVVVLAGARVVEVVEDAAGAPEPVPAEPTRLQAARTAMATAVATPARSRPAGRDRRRGRPGRLVPLVRLEC